jgi:hypothetical protein
LFRRGDDAFEFRRAVAHLHHGHAAAAPIKQFLADTLEDGKGKRTRTRIEVENTPGGLLGKSGRRHEGKILFLLEYCSKGILLLRTKGFRIAEIVETFELGLRAG